MVDQVSIVPFARTYMANVYQYQGFIQDFLLEGEIIVCGNLLKLEGSGGMILRKILKFPTTETF